MKSDIYGLSEAVFIATFYCILLHGEKWKFIDNKLDVLNNVMFQFPLCNVSANSMPKGNGVKMGVVFSAFLDLEISRYVKLGCSAEKELEE